MAKLGNPPIRVPDWWDVFEFVNTLGRAVLECPDCEKQSPELSDIRAAAEWVRGHYEDECEARNATG